ncbi:Uncharacterised protein [Chlamydia abortus]|jgi:hypothetical protein|uniref:Uncharacterized protein n=1 Tax=Paenibacillus residui TaxID=629724 RepID=A0ABW3DA82_9BACL|nr:hypothetical protein [Paenibacillus sp. 32O-W]SHE10628.1 Uncharacterised protein [Chlamydia abortus]
MSDERKPDLTDEQKITGQTAFETAGIPTPPDQEDMGATDGISEVVEAILDNIEDNLFPASEDEERPWRNRK